MSEMVERVAKALARADHLRPITPDDDSAELDWNFDLTRWDRGSYLAKARAAIVAMREPTDAMVNTAMDVCNSTLCDGEFRENWSRMVDEALK
jgi:hypothetical protein